LSAQQLYHPLTLTQLYYLLVSSVHLSTDVKINPLIGLLSKNDKFYVKCQAVTKQCCSPSKKCGLSLTIALCILLKIFVIWN